MKLLYLDSHKKFSLRRNRPERGLRHGWWMAFVTRDEAIFFFTRNGDLNDIIPENGEIDFTRKRKTKERAGVWISLKITSKKFQFLPKFSDLAKSKPCFNLVSAFRGFLKFEHAFKNNIYVAWRSQKYKRWKI